jgi:hypothetical protein
VTSASLAVRALQAISAAEYPPQRLYLATGLNPLQRHTWPGNERRLMAAEMDELVRLIEGEQIADVAYRERVICLVE